MNWLCWLGFHRWRAFGGESVRDGRGKVLLQWEICPRVGCRAMRPRNTMLIGRSAG